ncbi:MAG: four helix bundle protein, partial [Myxococcota bacterium]
CARQRGGGMDPTRPFLLPHHQLAIYGVARKLLQLVGKRPIGDADLRSQSLRAAQSVVLNIAEGAALRGAAKKRHYRIAGASAVEVAAAYEVAADSGDAVPEAEVAALVGHVYAVMSKLAKR